MDIYHLWIKRQEINVCFKPTGHQFLSWTIKWKWMPLLLTTKGRKCRLTFMSRTCLISLKEKVSTWNPSNPSSTKKHPNMEKFQAWWSNSMRNTRSTSLLSAMKTIRKPRLLSRNWPSWFYMTASWKSTGHRRRKRDSN